MFWIDNLGLLDLTNSVSMCLYLARNDCVTSEVHCAWHWSRHQNTQMMSTVH